MKYNLYTASMSAYDLEENAVITIDALVKATSKDIADEITFNRLMENFPADEVRYASRCYTTSLINDLLDKMGIEKYQAAYMITNDYRVIQTPKVDNTTICYEEKGK